MSGDALIREVRQLSPLLPVILVSGYVGDAGMFRSRIAQLTAAGKSGG